MDKVAPNTDLKFFSIDNRWAKRIFSEDEDNYRSSFSKDRDRILYSKQFRRLSGKTQVFIVGFDDHFRTRLTHTLEVVQLATNISRRIGLNVELTEAIALGHDVGHAPFGHVGERFLNMLMNGCYSLIKFDKKIFTDEDNEETKEWGFKHNWQSIRVISSLEKHRRSFANDGLNLTNFTRWGILHHTSLNLKECPYCTKSTDDKTKSMCGYLNKNIVCPRNGIFKINFYDQYKNSLLDDDNWSYEAMVVNIADEIAQRHHDIEDGIEAGVLHKDKIINWIESIFDDELIDIDRELIAQITEEDDKNFYLPLISHLIINILLRNLTDNSISNLNELYDEYRSDIEAGTSFEQIRQKLKYKVEKSRINYSNTFAKKEKKLQKHLFGRIVNSFLAQKLDGKSEYLLRQLTNAYIINPQQLPDSTIRTLFTNLIIRIYEINQVENLEKINKVIKDITINREVLEEMETGEMRIILNMLHKSQWRLYEHALLRTICDYLAGMTDQYATEQYNELYGIRTKKAMTE